MEDWKERLKAEYAKLKERLKISHFYDSLSHCGIDNPAEI
jgi:hypothetical protein